MHNITRMEESPKSLSHIRPKAGDGSPEWYAPHRDLLHNFGPWMHLALKRFDDQPEEEQRRVLEVVQGLAEMVNGLHEGKFAGNSALMEERLKALSSIPGYEAAGAAFLTTMLWKFWQYAGDVSLRQEGPIK